MTEAEYITYFENLARKNVQLKHNPEQNKKSFFCIADTYSMVEFDNALRSCVSFPALLLDVPTGFLSDNGGTNFTRTIKGEFQVVSKSTKENSRIAREDCFRIGMDILARIHLDARSKTIIKGRTIYFMIDDIPYQPTGPMALDHYGYAFHFRLICPFSLSVKAGNWSDII